MPTPSFFKFFSSPANYDENAMTMSFLLHDSLGGFEASEIGDTAVSANPGRRASGKQRVTILGEKLRIPEVGPVAERQRLIDLLERSIEQFGATLISGRTGTGKTAVAAEFARQRERTAWYSIEPADGDWNEFSSYFIASLFGAKKTRRTAAGKPAAEIPSQADASEFLAGCFQAIEQKHVMSPRLIVLDNIHHLFDAPWFGDFFRQLVTSLDRDTHLLMLCRSKPNAPLWRLRSKQMLNVIDENLLDFTEAETRQLCRLRSLPEGLAPEVHRRSFGRVAKIVEILDDLSRRSVNTGR